MKFQYITFILALIIFTSFTSASLGTYKQNDCVNIKTILNTSAVTLSTLNYPNNSLIVSGKPMTAIGKTFNYTTCSTSALGQYTYDYNDTEGNVYVNDFLVTPTGTDLTISLAFLFAFIVLGLAFLFWLFLGWASSNMDYGWKLGHYAGAYITALIIAFLGWYISAKFLYDLPLVSNVLNITWITMGVLLPILLIIFAFSLIREQVKQTEQEKKNKMFRD